MLHSEYQIHQQPFVFYIDLRKYEFQRSNYPFKSTTSYIETAVFLYKDSYNEVRCGICTHGSADWDNVYSSNNLDYVNERRRGVTHTIQMNTHL